MTNTETLARCGWLPIEIAPKKCQPILLNIKKQGVTVGSYSPAQKSFVYCLYQIDLYNGEWNDCYFDNEWDDGDILGWRPLPSATGTRTFTQEDVEGAADIEHEQWMAWAKTILETENISEDRAARWRQYFVPYSELDEETKEHDRVWARKALEAIGRIEG